jgi:hypothetical protein
MGTYLGTLDYYILLDECLIGRYPGAGAVWAQPPAL